jgi:hypothetical protein
LVESIEAYHTVVRMTDGGVGLGYEAVALARAGRLEDAKAVLARLEQQRESRYVSPLEFALVYGALGGVDDALTELERAYEDRVSDFARVRLLHWPDAVREHPRFIALLRKLGVA